MEVSYNAIRGSLEVAPDLKQDPGDSSSSCFLVFDGVDLTEDGLKDWLRLCTTQVMTVCGSRSQLCCCASTHVFTSAFAGKEDQESPFASRREARSRESRHVLTSSASMRRMQCMRCMQRMCLVRLFKSWC